ncbi:MAG: hypothetical protein WCY34_05155, partial [Candidatus Omnitrophota bacterium]
CISAEDNDLADNALNKAFENVYQHGRNANNEDRGALLLRFRILSPKRGRFSFILLDRGKGFIDRYGKNAPIEKAVLPGVSFGEKGKLGMGLTIMVDNSDHILITTVTGQGKRKLCRHWEKGFDAEQFHHDAPVESGTRVVFIRDVSLRERENKQDAIRPTGQIRRNFLKTILFAGVLYSSSGNNLMAQQGLNVDVSKKINDQTQGKFPELIGRINNVVSKLLLKHSQRYYDIEVIDVVFKEGNPCPVRVYINKAKGATPRPAFKNVFFSLEDIKNPGLKEAKIAEVETVIYGEKFKGVSKEGLNWISYILKVLLAATGLGLLVLIIRDAGARLYRYRIFRHRERVRKEQHQREINQASQRAGRGHQDRQKSNKRRNSFSVPILPFIYTGHNSGQALSIPELVMFLAVLLLVPVLYKVIQRVFSKNSFDAKSIFIENDEGLGISAKIKAGVSENEFSRLLKDWGIFDIPADPFKIKRAVLVGPDKKMQGFIEYAVIGEDCSILEIQRIWHVEKMPEGFAKGAVYILYINTEPEREHRKVAVGLLRYAIEESLRAGGKGVVAGRNVIKSFWSEVTGSKSLYCVEKMGSKKPALWIEEKPSKEIMQKNNLKINGQLVIFSSKGARQFISRYGRLQKKLLRKSTLHQYTYRKTKERAGLFVMAGFSLTGSVGFLLLAYCAYIYGYGVIEHILGFFIVMLPAGILGAGLGALLGLLFWIFIDKFIVHPLEMISKLFHDGCDFLIKGIAVKSKRAFRELRARFSKEKSDKFPLSLDNGGDFWSDFYCHSPNVFFGEGNLAQRHYQSDLVIQAFPKRLIKKGIYRKSKPWYDSIPLALNSPSARKIAKSIEALKRIKPRGKNKGISERARRLEKETAVIEVDMPSHFLLYGRDVFNQAYYQVTHVGKGSRTIYVPMMFMEDVEDLSYIATILHHDQMEIEDFSKFLERGEIVTNKAVEDAHAKAMEVDPFGVYRRISIRCRRMMAVSDMFTVAVVRKQREQARREIAKEEKRLQDMAMLHSVSNKEALEPRIILDRLSRLHILMACLYDFEDSRDKAVKHYGLAIESLKGIEENPDIDTGWLPMQINFRIVYILARQKMLSRLRREMVFLSRLEIGREASESEQESFRTLMEYGFYSVRHEVIGILKKHLSNTILNRASGTEYARILEAIKFIKRCKYFPNKGKDGQNKPLDNGGLKLSHQYEAMICHSINVFVRDLSSTTAFRNGKVTISREGLIGKITQDLKYLHQGLKPLVKFIGLSIKSVNEGGQKIKIRGYHLDNPALRFLLPINPVCEIDIAQVQPLTENDLPDELNALLRDYQDYYFGESLVVTFSNQSLDNGGTSFPGTDNARIKVLILCNQNKERSPLAAAMLRDNLPEDLKGKVEIASAAIYDIAPDLTIDMYTEKDPILSRHSPRCHTDADIKEAKIIFVMTARQKETILRLYPGCEDKVRLFLEEGDLNTCMQDHPSTSELFLPSAIPYKHLRRQIEENLNSVFRSVRKVVSENWKQDGAARKAINDGVVFININDLIESPLRFTHRPSPGKQIKGTLGSGSSSHPEPGCQFPEVII